MINSIALICIAAAVLCIIVIALYEGLTVREYTVRTVKVKKEHTFALITDLHSTLYGKSQEKLTEKILSFSPEAIFFSGDIVDDRRDFDSVRMLLNSVAKSIPCYYVAGNHERCIAYADDIKKQISECGVNVISNISANLGDNIVLYGIDDPLYYINAGEEDNIDAKFKEALNKLSPKEQNYNILLSHRPEFAPEYGSFGFDLALCGHAHGGQVRLPYIINGLYAPHQGLFPKYAGGKYSFENGRDVIVSRGLMKNILPRVFNPPELVIVKIKTE